MGSTLLDHWKEAERTESSSKVYHFLVSFYADEASHIDFPPRSSPTSPPLELEAESKPPKSPERIRQLLLRIHEAVEASRTTGPAGSGWTGRRA